MKLPSTKPYLVRAIYEWCCDNGFTPYMAVSVDAHTQVPREFVKDGQIVLNIDPGATNRLNMGNEFVDCQARCGGVARDISVPIRNIAAIYARENGAGMAFEPEEVADTEEAGTAIIDEPTPEPPSPPAGRPKLQRIK